MTHDHNDHQGHDHAAHDHGAHEHHDHEPPAGATNLVACAVMPATQVDRAWAEKRGLFRDYEGTRYWLCCAECEALFEANSARYANGA